MKKLQCELCGGLDLLKEGDYFVCQYCGCKYSLQDARNLVSGTVTIDRSGEYENLMLSAENARTDGDPGRALGLYQQALGMQPASSEANFWYGVVFASTNNHSPESAQVACNYIKRGLALSREQKGVDEYRSRTLLAINTVSNLLASYNSRFANERDAHIEQADQLRSMQLSGTTSALEQSAAYLEYSNHKDKANQLFHEQSFNAAGCCLGAVLAATGDIALLGANSKFWETAEGFAQQVDAQFEKDPAELKQFRKSLQNGRNKWFNDALQASGKSHDYANLKGQVASLQQGIAQLKAQRSSLKLFDLSGKSAIDQQINGLQGQIRGLNNQIGKIEASMRKHY